MKKISIFLIRLYQNTLSPFLGKNCRFTPSCSEYTIQAIKEYGTFKGICMGFCRIFRCNPLSKGGYDPVMKKNRKQEEI